LERAGRQQNNKGVFKMQLLIIILAAFGLGFWFARSKASQRVTDAVKDAGNRLRRNPEKENSEAAPDRGS
jgi:hypothetical protein